MCVRCLKEADLDFCAPIIKKKKKPKRKPEPKPVQQFATLHVLYLSKDTPTARAAVAAVVPSSLRCNVVHNHVLVNEVWSCDAVMLRDHLGISAGRTAMVAYADWQHTAHLTKLMGLLDLIAVDRVLVVYLPSPPVQLCTVQRIASWFSDPYAIAVKNEPMTTAPSAAQSTSISSSSVSYAYCQLQLSSERVFQGFVAPMLSSADLLSFHGQMDGIPNNSNDPHLQQRCGDFLSG